MIHSNYKKILVILLLSNVILFLLIYTFEFVEDDGYFTKFLGVQGIAFSSAIGAFVRWRSIRSNKTFEDFFFDTNFMLNAKMGVIIVGISAFIVWVFFIR